MAYVNHINIPDIVGNVFCKKLGRIALFDDYQSTVCANCDMFRGTAQGAGVECYWNDPRLSKEDGGLWRADDAQTELENYFTVAATAPESPQLTVPKVKKGLKLVINK